MSVIGFDIGNESCVIAVAKRGEIDILLNDEAKRETPSVVSFGDKQRFLGSAGAAFATSNPKSTITQIKRLVGRLYNEPSVQEDLKLLPFVTCKGPRGGILVELEYLNTKWTFSPVEILGMLFTHLKQVAEKNLESPVVDCVIGIPSYFTDLQRREYLDAARISGLRPLKLIHDGTAIALGYGMYKTDLSTSRPTVVVFVDIGHCDTQVTVAAFEQGGMEILSHSFDPNLGGRDFDEVLFRYFAAEFKERYNIDVYSNARASIRLRASCEKVKKVLSANAEAPISIECLIGDTDVRGLITRKEFEKLSQELLQRVTVPCRKAVYDSRLTVDRIYSIELVGSGSRIPAVTKILSELFHKEPTRTLNGSECVARGCALGCAMLSPSLQVRDYKIRDYFPYSIGGKNKAHQEITLFPKSSPFPGRQTMKYHGKTPLHIQVFYTDKNDFPAGLSPKVGHFIIGSSQSTSEEEVRALFNVKLNDNGVVEIESASLLENKRSLRKSAYSYPDNKMGNSQISDLAFSTNLDFATTEVELYEAQLRQRMLAEQDNKIEQIKDQRNTLESFVYETRSKLSGAYRSFASESEKKVITDSLQKTEDWLYEDSDDEYEQDYTGKLKDLRKLVEPVVNRYKVEKAKTEATKSLLTCIKEYRSAANYLPSIQKQEVNNECDQTEQFLYRVQNNPYTKNADPVEWSSIIKHGVIYLKWNCKNIMTAIRSFPMHSNERHQPDDSNQRRQPMDSNQRYQPADSNQRYNLNQLDHLGYSKQRDLSVDSNHKNQHVDLSHKNQRVVSNQKVQSGDSNQRDQPADSNQMGGYSNQKDQPTDSNQVGGDSNQKDQPADSNQMGSPVDSYQSDKHEDQPADSNQMGGDSNQKDQPVDSNQMGGESKQMGQPVDSNQMGPPVDSYQSDRSEDQPANSNQMVGESNQKEQPADSNHMGPPFDSYQSEKLEDEPVDSNQISPPIDSYQSDELEDEPADSNQMGPLVDLYQSDKPEGQPADSNQVDGDSNQMDQPANLNQIGPPVDSYQSDKHEEQPADSNLIGPPVDPYQSDKHEDQPADSNQMNQLADSNQSDKHEDQPADSNQKDQPADSNQMGPPVDVYQSEKLEDEPADSNQMGPPFDSYQSEKLEDEPADSNQMGPHVDWYQSDKLEGEPNQMGPPVDLYQRDKHEDSDQRDNHVDLNQRDQTVDSASKDQLEDMQLS